MGLSKVSFGPSLASLWPFHGLFLAIRSLFIAFSRPLLAFSSLFIAFPRPLYGSFHGLFLAFPQSLLGPFRTGLFKMLSFPSMLKSVTKFWSITITFQKGRVDMWSRGQLGENIGQVCHQNWYSNWVLSSVTRKNHQMSIKVCQKWFHYKNDISWQLYKNWLRMSEIWAN